MCSSRGPRLATEFSMDRLLHSSKCITNTRKKESLRNTSRCDGFVIFLALIFVESFIITLALIFLKAAKGIIVASFITPITRFLLPPLVLLYGVARGVNVNGIFPLKFSSY